jgi:protoporphyrinogen oxidase
MTEMNRKEKQGVAIIGTGYAGLAAAIALLEAGRPVTLFERGPVAGGLAQSLRVGGTTLERFYHHFFTSDTHLTDMAKKLGLGDKIVWIKPKTAIYYQGKLYSLKGAADLLKFEPLPFLERLRMGLLIARSYTRKKWAPLDRITAKDWIVRSVGPKAYQVLWEPLLASKFGVHAEKISAAWLWSKLKLRGSSRNKRGQEVLGYFAGGGFSQVTEAMVAKVRELGGVFHFNAQISQIKSGSRGVQITHGGGRVQYPQAIWTAAPSILPSVAPELPASYTDALKSILYQGNICMVVTMKQQISDIYWLSVEDLACPFVAVIEHTNFIDPKVYGGKHIMYLSRYLDPKDDLYSASDEVVTKRFFDYLHKIFPNFSSDIVESVIVSRASHTQPITPVGYGSRLPELMTPLPGLYLATMSQIYPEDRGTNYAIAIGQRAAQAVLASKN